MAYIRPSNLPELKALSSLGEPSSLGPNPECRLHILHKTLTPNRDTPRPFVLTGVVARLQMLLQPPLMISLQLFIRFNPNQFLQLVIGNQSVLSSGFLDLVVATEGHTATDG